MSVAAPAATRFRIIDTQTGPFALLRNGSDLHLTWVSGRADPILRGAEEDARLEPALVRRLRRYFEGEVVDFSDVPLPRSAPAFFRRCWSACRRIPRGETRTYAELAVMAGGAESAARAAGQAMRRNPLPIVVPCHRVRGAAGAGGFGGTTDPGSGPMRTKRWLLRMEGALTDDGGSGGRGMTTAGRQDAALRATGRRGAERTLFPCD
jgi:methylated-DNA-[protein]-cysteine S-methyltransferase